MKTAFFNAPDPVGNRDNIERIFADRQQLIGELTDLHPVIVTPENVETEIEKLQDLEVILSTWSMLPLTGEQIDRMPNLKAVLYAAGSVKGFGIPYLERGIQVSRAVEANGIPVAEFALAQVLLTGAGFWRNNREGVDEKSSCAGNSYRGHGNYDNRVAILGNGTISTHLQGLLAHHHLEVVVVPSRASSRTVSLEEAFETSFAVVNLFPNRDDNVGVFDGGLFASMMEGASFINVGRGAQVNEAQLIQVLKNRPDLTALLDVQFPEPPIDGSELYTLPNVLLSGHLAGSKGSEFRRMADYMVDDLKRLLIGEPLQHAADLETVKSMA